MNKKRVLLTGLVLVALLALATTAAQVGTGSALVGSWYVEVPESASGLPPFQALQTFHAGGTLTETSSLLAKGEEGPAHGVWNGRGRDYTSTFQLFVFDPDGNAVGKVQVRNSIHLDSADHFTAVYAVDFLAPDGSIESNIDTGTYEGTRIAVVGP